MDGIRDFVDSVTSKLKELKSALVSSKNDIKQLEEQNTGINTDLSTIKSEIKGFSEQKTLFSMALASFDGLSQKIAVNLDTSKADIDKTITLATKQINDAITAIPTPKDGNHGKDAVVDYAKLEESITAKAKEHKKQLSKELNKEISDNFAKIEAPKAEKVDYNVVDFKVRTAMSQIPKSTTTVKDISLKNRALVVDYTDGTTKSISLPMGGGTTVYSSGGEINLNTLTEIDELVSTDYVIIGRSGALVKIKADKAWLYFQSIIETAVTEDGEVLTEDGEPIIE